eukprot:6684164-Prymnesium_polylepis.1
MVARGWTCPQGKPTLVEWWGGVRPTRPRIEGSREPTLTTMANQPRHTHDVYAELCAAREDIHGVVRSEGNTRLRRVRPAEAPMRRTTHQAAWWRQQWSRTRHEAGEAGGTVCRSDGLRYTRHDVGDTGGA